MEYPASLLSKLTSDEEALHSSLSESSPAQSSVPASRDLLSRRLQASTPNAVRTLEELLVTGDDKVRLGAASKLLDLSPAREPIASTASLPPELLAPLVQTLAAFAQAAVGVLSPSPEPTYLDPINIQPEPILAPRRKPGRPPKESK